MDDMLSNDGERILCAVSEAGQRNFYREYPEQRPIHFISRDDTDRYQTRTSDLGDGRARRIIKTLNSVKNVTFSARRQLRNGNFAADDDMSRHILLNNFMNEAITEFRDIDGAPEWGWVQQMSITMQLQHGKVAWQAREDNAP